MGLLSWWSGRCVVTNEVNLALQALITCEFGFAAHLVTIEPQLAFMGANLPKMLKGLARVSQDGAYPERPPATLNALGFWLASTT